MARGNEFLSRQMCLSCYQIHVFVPSDRFTTAETPFSRARLSKGMRDTRQLFQFVFVSTSLAYLLNRASVWGRGWGVPRQLEGQRCLEANVTVETTQPICSQTNHIAFQKYHNSFGYENAVLPLHFIISTLESTSSPERNYLRSISFVYRP